MITLSSWLSACPLERGDALGLMQFVLNLSRPQIITHAQEPLQDRDLRLLRALTQRRLKGEPLPYLTGKQEFYGRDFFVSPYTLIPRPDTESLVEWLIPNIPFGSNVIDLGTGSGCIGITIKLERPDCNVVATDISPGALSIAKKNALSLNAEMSFFLSDWLADLPSGSNCNTIVSNPPYIRPSDEHLRNLSYEPRFALTDFKDGLSAYRKILKNLSPNLNSLNLIALEHGWDQGKQIREILEQKGFSGPHTYRDLGGNDRFTVWNRR